MDLVEKNIKYAQFLKEIRNFFDKCNVLEVVTPYLSSYAIPDVYIDSLEVTVNKNINKEVIKYLHTSPEIEMKKLLLQGHNNIYQIAKVFRDNEQGKINFNEFTMLEWYRCFEFKALINEVTAFITQLLKIQSIQTFTYQELFKRFAGINNIHSNTLEELKIFAKKHRLNDDFDDLADGQMFLFVHFVEEKLANFEAVFITNYPKEQAGLSMVQNEVALRFELYIKGVEIANGCQELETKQEYKKVFLADINKRKKLKKISPKLDKDFFNVFKGDSLNNCFSTSGVAIGLDRLFMLKYPKNF